MDSLLTPFPGKANDSKPKMNQKGNRGAKMITGEPRQNRRFGTSRNTNIQGKPVWDESFTKPKVARQTKPIIKPSQIVTNTNTSKNSPENVKLRLNKKSDILLVVPQQVAEKTSQENVSAEPKTPVTSTPSSSDVRGNKSKVVVATPFYTAVNCSKCRFDKLGTSSHWIGQIKLAESAGKHWVASHFFRIAFEYPAEPIRNLRIEVKKYLIRHGHLAEQKEWGEVAVMYGLKPEISNTIEMESETT